MKIIISLCIKISKQKRKRVKFLKSWKWKIYEVLFVCFRFRVQLLAVQLIITISTPYAGLTRTGHGVYITHGTETERRSEDYVHGMYEQDLPHLKLTPPPLLHKGMRMDERANGKEQPDNKGQIGKCISYHDFHIFSIVFHY